MKYKKNKKKITQNKLKIILVLLFVTLIVFNFKSFIEESEVKDAKYTTLFFVGDIMLDRGVKSSVEKNFGGDYSKLFENLNELKEADILFGNLEGDVSDKGNNVGSKYSFRMDPKVLPVLKEAGFDIVSFANNHVGDWNIDAFTDTLSRLELEDNNILKTGAGKDYEEASTPVIIEKNGVRFGFLGFSDVGPDWIKAKISTPGILLASDPKLSEIIKKAKEKCDVLVVSFHFGEEYKLIHNKRQENLAHTAIDSGADLIIGHHPHVIEDIEEYKGKPIVYSLGNFIFDQYFSEETMTGMLFSVTYEEKNLIETEQKIITLNKKYQPEKITSLKKYTKPACPKPQKEYDDMSLLNIGQEKMLPDPSYIPSDLIDLDDASSTRNGICLIKDTRDAFQSMVNNAKKDGIIIKASSGFRSYELQRIIFSNALETQADALISIAKPGYSEHQLGTTVDLTGLSVNYSSTAENFDIAVESLWLQENAHLYGFVQSYPKDKEEITGYKYEPWHYRYVGIKNAKTIKESGLTLTEFLK